MIKPENTHSVIGTEVVTKGQTGWVASVGYYTDHVFIQFPGEKFTIPHTWESIELKEEVKYKFTITELYQVKAYSIRNSDIYMLTSLARAKEVADTFRGMIGYYSVLIYQAIDIKNGEVMWKKIDD